MPTLKNIHKAILKKRIAKTKANAHENDLFCRICKSTLALDVVREFKFHPIRKWRFDYAIISPVGAEKPFKIAIEVEGGVWTGGRHTNPKGFMGDVEKYNAGTMLGWKIFRVTPDTLVRTSTLDMIKEAINN